MGEWIECVKQLPPDSRVVLVYFDDGSIYTAKWLDPYWIDPDGLDFNYGRDVPTHWMPLPSPPKQANAGDL